MANSKYYDPQPLLSRDGLFNFVVGGRGIGKTFAFKKKVMQWAIREPVKKALQHGIETGEEFIILRRHKSELKFRQLFFDDIREHFPDHDFKVEGFRALVAPADSRKDKKRAWKTIGHFVALSTAQTLKSAPFSNVTTIIFDEFIVEKGYTRYITDEVNVFNGFYVSIDRWQDRVKVYFLANAVSIECPYFIHYDIRPENGVEWVTKKGGTIVAQFPEETDFVNEALNTRYGQLIKDTEFADYALGNEFSDNNEYLLDIKDIKARYVCSLETATGTFSVWYSTMRQCYFVQSRRPKTEILYTLLPEKLDRGKILMNTKDPLLTRFRRAFRTANMFFDSARTRNAFIQIFK